MAFRKIIRGNTGVYTQSMNSFLKYHLKGDYMLKSISSRVIYASLFMVSLVSAPAMAAGPDFTSLTDAVDFSTVQTAILSIASLVAAVYVLTSGVKKVLGTIKSA